MIIGEDRGFSEPWGQDSILSGIHELFPYPFNKFSFVLKLVWVDILLYKTKKNNNKNDKIYPYHNTHACMLNCFSRIWLLVTPMDSSLPACSDQGFSRQEHWSGLPCPPPGDLPNPGIISASLTSPTLADGFFTTNPTWKAYNTHNIAITNFFLVCKSFPKSYSSQPSLLPLGF